MRSRRPSRPSSQAANITTAARFAGTDRADTSAQAAEYAVKNLNFTNAHVGVASGYVDGYGADALAGGPLEGKEKSPMLVTKDVNNPGASVLAYLKDHANTLEDGHIYGGTAAVSTSAQTAMENAAQSVSSNQTYAVTGGSANATSGQVLTYSVGGIDADKVRIVLADAGQVTTNSANGVVTFKGTNPGGAGNTATLASGNTATISVVNGTPQSGSPDAVDATANGGTVTFSVTTGSGSFVPVVFSEKDGNTVLELNADGTPKESFGVGQQTDIVGAEATTGSISAGTVSTVNKAADFFETNSDATTYYYDSNDVFQVKAPGATTYSTVTMAQFEALCPWATTWLGCSTGEPRLTSARSSSTTRLRLHRPR